MADGRGGRRPGAGRKKGGANRLTEEAIAKAKDGLDPLDYLLCIVRNDGEDQRTRMDAAKACLPYTHHKLISKETEHSGSLDLGRLVISD